MSAIQLQIPVLLLVVLLGAYAQGSYNLRPIVVDFDPDVYITRTRRCVPHPDCYTDGVLSQHPPDSILEGLEDKNYTSYIAASYIKFLESGGARVVPILINQDDDYYKNITYSLNGILFPGGGTSITNSSGYGAAGKKLYDHVVEINKKGTYLPLWGTCLGFEMLTYLAANNTKWLSRCNANNKADPLVLQDDYLDSRLFAQMPENIINTLRTENVTANFHHWCLTPENYTASELSEQFKMLATSKDFYDLEYVSLIEHRDLPIFGSQFHPEKNPFEWADDSKHDAISHTPQAIEMAQYFTNFFIGQARQNNQSFATEEEESSALIYNYEPFFTGSTSGFVQCYLFR